MAVAGLLVAAASALAADVIYHNGFLHADYPAVGARHSLTSNSARKIGANGNHVCVITKESTNQTYDTTGYCTNVQDQVVVQNLCGCKLRYPWTYTFPTPTYGTDARARYTY